MFRPVFLGSIGSSATREENSDNRNCSLCHQPLKLGTGRLWSGGCINPKCENYWQHKRTPVKERTGFQAE